MWYRQFQARLFTGAGLGISLEFNGFAAACNVLYAPLGGWVCTLYGGISNSVPNTAPHQKADAHQA